MISPSNIFGQIYLITNLVNGKVYIGQTTKSIEKRFSYHIYDSARKKFEYNVRFYNALRKHGRENFKIESICFCYSKPAMDEAEISLIELYNSRNPNAGYNISIGGDGTVGVKASEETRRKLRESHTGKKMSEAAKQKISAFNLGSKRSEEAKRAMSVAMMGNKNGVGSVGPWRGKKILFCQKWKRKCFRRGANSPSSKPVVQLNGNKEPMATFASIKEASKKLKIHDISTAIKKNITELKIKRGGFYWMFLIDYKNAS